MSSSFRDLAGRQLDERSERLIEGLFELAENKGKKIVRHECSRCGERQEIEVEVMDGKLTVDTLRFLSEQGFGRAAPAAPANESAVVATTQKDLESLTDAELCLLIAQQGKGETLRDQLDRLRQSAMSPRMLDELQALIDELRKPKTPATS